MQVPINSWLELNSWFHLLYFTNNSNTSWTMGRWARTRSFVTSRGPLQMHIESLKNLTKVWSFYLCKWVDNRIVWVWSHPWQLTMTTLYPNAFLLFHCSNFPISYNFIYHYVFPLSNMLWMCFHSSLPSFHFNIFNAMFAHGGSHLKALTRVHGNSRVKLPKTRIILRWVTFLALHCCCPLLLMVHPIIVCRWTITFSANHMGI